MPTKIRPRRPTGSAGTRGRVGVGYGFEPMVKITYLLGFVTTSLRVI